MVLNRKSRGFKPEVTWFGMGNRGPVGKKGSRAQSGETPRTSPTKRMAGSGNTAEEARAQSPNSNWSNGGGPLSEKKNLLSYFFFHNK